MNRKKPWSTDPIGKTQEIAWFFSVQSKFQDYMMEIFVPWNESNLVRLLSQIFSGRESVVKLFDFRILSTLLIRDIRIFILKGQAIKAVMIIALPLLFSFLNTRALIERNKSSYNLMKIFPAVQHLGARARKENLLLVPHLFMFSPKAKRRYQRCLLNPKEHVWILSSSNTNLNQKNRISEKQETINWESPLEKESNGIEWEIDSSFNSIPNEYWEPETEPENLYEWKESILYRHRSKVIEELENKIEQLEEKLVQVEEEFALSSEPEQFKSLERERKQRVREIERYKEGLRRIKKLCEKRSQEMEQEKMFQEESDQARESFSFSESEVFERLFEHLSIDESCISINYTNKPSEKFKLLKERQDAFQYFRGLEKNRIVDLWKVKTFLKNPPVNYDILPDPEWNISKDINQFNCIRFMNKNSSSRSPSSCDQNKEQLALNDDFQLKQFVLKITDQFTLSITRPNHISYPNDAIDVDIDHRVNELHLFNQTLLKCFNYFFNYRDELTHDSFLRVLNIFEKKKTSEDDNTEQLILNKIVNKIQIVNKDKIQADEHVKIDKFDFLKNVEDFVLNDLKSETVLDDLESFQKYYLEYHKYYMELKRYSLELQKVLNKNKYYLELQKVLNKYYLKLQRYSLELQKVLNKNKYYLELQKVLNKYYLKLQKAFHKYSLAFHEYSFELQKVLNKNKLESQKVLDKYYLELHNYLGYFYVELQKYSLELQKVLNKNKYYMELQKYSLELQKVLNKNKYYLEFIYFIKTLSRNLNNVTQDAINQYSSSWILCQKEYLERPFFRPVELRNPNFLNAFVLSIQIEYFQKRLEYLLSISKQNNFKKRVLDPIELSITQHWSWFGPILDSKINKILWDNLNSSQILWDKLNGNVWDKLNENEIKSKSIPNLEFSINKPTLDLNEKKPIIEFIIDFFDNGKNYMELLELLNNAGLSEIFDNQDNWLNPLKLSNKNSLRASFYKANTFEFLDYLHRPRLFYKKRLASYMGKINIKNKNVTYGQLLNLVPIHNNLFSSSISEMRAVYSEKETISLIKSQVNILLDKYLRDKVLIHDLHKSSNLLDKLNSILRRNINLSIEDISKPPLISLQIVNFDKNSCYPFLNSSDLEEKTSSQYSKNSFSSNIDLIQTQSYQDDVLSEIFLRIKKIVEKEEKYSSTESLEHIIEDKAIGDFMEDKAIGDFIEVKDIGDFFNKEKLKFFFSKLKFLISFNEINFNFEKWGLFQTYRSWLWLLTSTGWKYTKNLFLATFPEITINSIDQLVSMPDNIRQNWNHNLNILWALYHQFWTLLKWEFRNKIDQILTILKNQILTILNDQILPILNDQILPMLNLMLSRWNIDKYWQVANEKVLKAALEGKDLSISFDTWKYIQNVREYDIFLCIFVGFFFYISSIIPLFLIQFYRNFYLIRFLQYSHCSERVGEMIRSYKRLRNFSNLNWYGSWLTFVDYIEMESDPDDIGLFLLLKIWYVKNIQFSYRSWFSLPWFQRDSGDCGKYKSLVKKILYEFEVDDFLLRENRLFLLQEQISQFESKLTPPIGLFHELETRKQPGLLYFRYLAEFIQRGLRIGLMNSELNSLFLAEMPIFAAFYQKMTSVPIRPSLYDHVRFYPLYPVPSFSNRILLIGPKETGRSYLAKSLAADSYLPLIRISPKSFLRQQKLLSRYEPEYTSSAKQSYLEHENILRSLGWSGRPKDIHENEHYEKKPHNFLYDRSRRENPNPPEYFARRVIQFQFALKLAKLMSPCVIWIPSIHELNDYYYLLALLVELLGDPYNPSDGEKETTIKQNIVVIASTDIPKKIDPVLISPPRSKRRFDTFINTKKLPAPYREKEFPLLLRNKGLYLKKEWNCYDEFGLTTKGFTAQDLAKLADEIFLISMSQNTSAIDNDIIGVALYRSNWGPCNYNLKFSEFFQGLPYKIGKAIIQNKLTYLKNSLRLNLDFQGRRANYLHQWYLEPSIAGTAAKEFTVFYHILGCLAGSVAQDCWFLSESNRENWSPFDPFIENDFILASNLLQGLLEEFPSLAIYRGNSDSITIAPQFKKDTMQKGLSSLLDKIVLSKELRNSYGTEDETPIVCDSRTWRFSFIRSNRFEHIKDITIENPLLDYLHLFGSFQERPTRLSSLYWKKFLMSGPDLRPVYGGKDDIVERQTAAYWEAKLLYKKFQRLGIYQFDTEEYALEYQPLNTPVICLARRFLWDPVSIRFLNKHPAFERRELLVSKEIVKSIYLTYSKTRELNVSIKKSLKAIRKRKRVRKIALEMKIQTNDDDLPLSIKMEEREHFETFKRFQEIGIRLRRVLPYPQSVVSERWFREKTRDDKFKQRLLKGERENRDLLSNESLIYKTLSESHEYLSNLFFSNRMLFKQMIDTLVKTKWLSTNDIDCLLAEGLNKKKKA
uniref:Protein Ycf2 n=1 Tax=Chamaecyparis obtusa var. obtusa TaxID=257617 RepID=A0A7R6V0X9_CHAOB|nr:hypothetical protein RF2 [Chamaecyparis obtusa var. obtusa]BCB64928.1 hypothetical protein RF2 [Chamaecyparis obtusa var. obtusa]BCB65011.1 hypothetical protein RF2 [Chamaecyparis obtusa var. obtusa]BCB65094.1 hypothetical protein RF2 [Chamaecyparis obtusa var. obtusa]BCB65177.1 hypothetical protein RF2 [Chamaecyparis obtusa var. obtusa]